MDGCVDEEEGVDEVLFPTVYQTCRTSERGGRVEQSGVASVSCREMAVTCPLGGDLPRVK